MNIIKPLLLLGLASLLTGCFLTLDIGEGGYVESTIGDCEEFSSCSYEVADTSFDESFTAVAKGGYVFSHWRGGDGYQCPGSENPVCVVSNTQGAGNANVEAIVASDSEFGNIEPVFRALRVPTPVVVDATGKVVGVPFEENLVLLDFEQGAHAYPAASGTWVLFSEYSCQGDARISVSETHLSTPYTVRRAGTDTFYVAIPDGLITDNSNAWLSRIQGNTGGCQNSASTSGQQGLFRPAVAIEFPLVLPMKIEIR